MPSSPLVCSRSPTCTSALAEVKRSSMPAPTTPPKAAPRCWVRRLSTGMAASLSASKVTSDVNA